MTFSLGAGPVPSLLLSEILPARIREKAMAVCMAVHWVIMLSPVTHMIVHALLCCFFNGNAVKKAFAHTALLLR